MDCRNLESLWIGGGTFFWVDNGYTNCVSTMMTIKERKGKLTIDSDEDNYTDDDEVKS